ncbi:MAG: Hsp70 family protein [Desulfomonile tiedjei]|uniref:Hsp70 family protein n=1 Tax=Desulfomonile tiedjei TaxID=2358 RepID=A0A9D6V964_9BACT|nr:Hsp70 family protein [Desulfomonile tiedjei]
MGESCAVGIDLGTTNSVVSIWRHGRVETIPIRGFNKTPSVVSFDDDGILVGEEAKSRLDVFPETTVGSVKRFMGDRTKTPYEINGQKYTPVDISALILKKLVEGASEYLGEPVKRAVISVPAYFNEDQKEDTKLAAEQAGLEVMRLVAEPTAAALAYGFRQKKDQLLLVYDLGGGTFDVSILKVEGDDFRVIAVDGDARLGGDDFDEAIMKHLSTVFADKTGKDITGQSSRLGRIALQKLKEQAEKAKIKLALFQEAEIKIPDLLGVPFIEKLTRPKFVDLIQPFLNKTVQKVDSVLKSAKLKPDQIDRVILVGGSTRIPAIKDILKQKIGDPYTADNVDEIVAAGAAIFAYWDDPDHPGIDDRPALPRDVTAHALGIEMLKDDFSGVFFQPLIDKNTEYPCKGGVTGFSVTPYQKSVLMKVYRESLAGENCKGDLSLPITVRREPVPAMAVFDLDRNGIIHFTAVEMLVSEGAQENLRRSLARKEAKNKVAEMERSLQSYFETQARQGRVSDFEPLDRFIKDGWVRAEEVRINPGIKS